MAEANIAYGVDSFEVSGSLWQEVLPQHPNRLHLMIQNRGTSDVYLAFDDSDDEDFAIRLHAGAFFEPFVVPTNKIKMKAETGTTCDVVVISNTQADLDLEG